VTFDPVGQARRSRSEVEVHGHWMKNVSFSATDAHCDVTYFWLFVELFALEWLVHMHAVLSREYSISV